MRLKFVFAAASAALGALAAEAEIAARFGQADTVWSAQISPSGGHLMTGCGPMGERAVCVFDLKTASQPQLLPTPDGARLSRFYWASDRYAIVDVSIIRTARFSEGMADVVYDRALAYDVVDGSFAPLMSNYDALRNTTGVVSLLIDDPEKVRMATLVSSDGDYVYTPFEVNLETGRARRRNRERGVLSISYNARGDELARVLYDRGYSDFEIVAANGRTVYEDKNADIPPMRIRGLAAVGDDLIVSADSEDVSGLMRLAPETGEISNVDFNGEPLGRVTPILDQYTGRITGFNHTGHLPRQEYFDEELSGVQEALHDALASESGSVLITSYSQDREAMTIAVLERGRPTHYYLFERSSASVSPIGTAADQLAATPLGTVEPVTYPASDGMNIPAYLTLPPGKTMADGPFSLVVMPHGGPEARDIAGFDWWAQAYSAAGYAVLQPNFRGSAGYGAAFRNAGYGEFGARMIDDVIDGARFLQSQGVAKRGPFCVAGASYGGYAALMSGVRASEQVGCVISVNGVTDPISLMGDAARFGGGSDALGVRYWQRYMGDRFADRDAHAAITPLRNITAFGPETPVLMIHGDEDMVVNVDQARGFQRLADNASWLRYVEIESEDHFLRSAKARQVVLTESLAFLRRYNPATTN